MKTLIKICLAMLVFTTISAHGQTNQPDWTVDPVNYSYDMEVVAQVFFNASPVTANGILGAFIDGTLQGVKAVGLNYSGKYVFIMRVYGNIVSGKTITFKFYDTARDRVYDITETIPFMADSRVGNGDTPQLFHAIMGSDATLSDLRAGGVTITGFNSSTLTYIVKLPKGTLVPPVVTATTTDIKAGKLITPAASIPGVASVLVTAENGTTQKTYTVSFDIIKGTDATLRDLKVDGTTLTDFNPGTLDYLVVLPHGTLLVPTVTATTTDASAAKLITPAPSVPGTTSIAVTAEDGIAQKIYTVYFSNSSYINKPSWVFNESDYSLDAEVIAQVYVDNLLSTAADGILGCFVGSSCRGVKTGGSIGPTGKFVISIRCYSNTASGETLTFRYFDPILDTVLPIRETVAFEPNIIVGTGINPFLMHASTNLIAIKPLAAGWNWFSLNLLNSDMSLNNVLASVSFHEGDYIKSQTLSAMYYKDFGWFGDLTTIDPTEMYKIKVSAMDTIEFVGFEIIPGSLTVSVKVGWNWIGYPLLTPGTVENVLKEIYPVVGDYIKNQTLSNSYYAGSGWFGELNNMVPLDGYMLKTSHTGTLSYTSGAGGYTDTRDGTVYPWVRIGTQSWMLQNLSYLPSVSPSASGSDVIPYYYVYGYQGTSVSDAKATSNFNTYGVLYNWEAAKTACPSGWHLPTDEEWKTLEKYLGMSVTESNTSGWRNSGSVGTKMKSTTLWPVSGRGDNSSGFTALPGGNRGTSGGFYNIGTYSVFWSATSTDLTNAWYRGYYSSDDGSGRDIWYRYGGFSVRCLRN
jgi:uncharacterized protein (TIGR02145 family)